MDAMQIQQTVSAAVFVAGVVVLVIARFKYKPGQKETTDMTVAQSTLNIAQGTIDLVTSELEQQFKRMTIEQTEQREIHRKEQAELRELHAAQVETERKAALEAERKASEIQQQLAAVNEEVLNLRTALRDTQTECDNWRKKYEALIAREGDAG